VLDEVILETEHGPKGGDEINKIIYKGNYGWPISSYGKKYKSEETYKKSHKQFGFQEPIFSFVPSIGISQIIDLENNFSKKWQNNFLISSLRGQSIYRIKFDDTYNKVLFIEKIRITLDNLEVTKEKGISEGVSNIFIENMNKLSIKERPMHCTDVNKEIVYIKSADSSKNGQGEWKIDNNKLELKEALQKVSKVQQKNLDEWTKKNEGWEKNQKLQEEYMILVKNCTDDLKDKNEDKVIKKLCNNINISEILDK